MADFPDLPAIELPPHDAISIPDVLPVMALRDAVLFPFGSPNTTGVGALCYVSFAMIAPHVTMGGMMINMFSDIENAGLIVVWGANPATDCPPLDLKVTNRGFPLTPVSIPGLPQ